MDDKTKRREVKMRKIVQALRRKVRLGRLAVPIWAIALTVLIVGAVAGQAIGPVLSGSVSGTTAVTASQSIVLDPDNPPAVDGATRALAVVSTDGTSCTVAIETHVGQIQTLTLGLKNANTSNAASAILQLSAPAGIVWDISVDNMSDGIARLSSDSFLFTIDADSTVAIPITIAALGDAAPGTYNVGISVIQVAH
jgi:hypothetical protein